MTAEWPPTRGIRVAQSVYRQLNIRSPTSRLTGIPRTDYPFDRILNDNKAVAAGYH